jgi:hypothetical protein
MTENNEQLPILTNLDQESVLNLDQEPVLNLDNEQVPDLHIDPMLNLHKDQCDEIEFIKHFFNIDADTMRHNAYASFTGKFINIVKVFSYDNPENSISKKGFEIIEQLLYGNCSDNNKYDVFKVVLKIKYYELYGTEDSIDNILNELKTKYSELNDIFHILSIKFKVLDKKYADNKIAAGIYMAKENIFLKIYTHYFINQNKIHEICDFINQHGIDNIIKDFDNELIGLKTLLEGVKLKFDDDDCTELNKTIHSLILNYDNLLDDVKEKLENSKSSDIHLKLCNEILIISYSKIFKKMVYLIKVIQELEKHFYGNCEDTNNFLMTILNKINMYKEN